MLPHKILKIDAPRRDLVHFKPTPEIFPKPQNIHVATTPKPQNIHVVTTGKKEGVGS